MTDEIRIAPDGVRRASSSLTRGSSAYCSFRLRNISGMVPGAGSAYHDGRLSQQSSRALEAYRALLESDARRVDALGAAYTAVDASGSALFGLR